MDVYTLLVVGIALAVGRLSNNRNQNIRTIMAAIQNLETAVNEAQTKLGNLSTSVNRILEAVDPSKEGKIQAAADSIASLGNTLDTLKSQIDAVVPPAV